MALLLPPGSQFFDSNGNPCASGSLTWFNTGTTNPKVIYTDPDLTIEATNPYSLDSSGRIAANLFGSGTYTVILKDSTGATVWSRDEVFGWGEGASGASGNSRGIRQIVDAAAPLTTIPDQCVIKKLRSDYMEFAIYSPLEPTGAKWVRHLHSDRLLPTNSGVPELVFSTLSTIYASATVNRTTANAGAGYTAATPTATYATTDSASRTGTWTGAATVDGVTDINYSSTIGNSVSYTYTIPANGRIVLRGYSASNGGIAAVSIVDGGSNPIASDKWLLPSTRLVSYAILGVNGEVFMPVAHNLSAGTYTVTLTVDASNPAGGRLYDGGGRADDPIEFDAVGVHGTAATENPSTFTTTVCRQSGMSLVRLYQDCTQIDYSYVASSNSGIVDFTVYDSVGAEIATYENESADMYTGGTITSRTVTVARDLTKGDYYLHAKVASTKNANAAAYRLYELNSIAYDQTTIGDPATDTFDDLGVPGIYQSETITNVLMGPANLFYATSWRDPAASWLGGDNFVSGVHRNETALDYDDLTVKVDGVTIDLDAASAGDQWIGSKITVDYSTTLQYPGTATNFGTLARAFVYQRGGLISAETTRTLTRDSVFRDDYILMLQEPNGGDVRSDDVGGGFDRWAVDNGLNYDLGNSNNTSTNIAPTTVGLATWNDEYIVYSTLVNKNQIDSQFAGNLSNTFNVLFRDNATHQAKGYIRSTGNAIAGGGDIELPSGHVSRVVKVYRIVPSSDGDVLLAG
jgi:hypothetical protein